MVVILKLVLHGVLQESNWRVGLDMKTGKNHARSQRSGTPDMLATRTEVADCVEHSICPKCPSHHRIATGWGRGWVLCHGWMEYRTRSRPCRSRWEFVVAQEVVC